MAQNAYQTSTLTARTAFATPTQATQSGVLPMELAVSAVSVLLRVVAPIPRLRLPQPVGAPLRAVSTVLPSMA